VVHDDGKCGRGVEPLDTTVVPHSRYQPYPVNPPFDLATELNSSTVAPDRPVDPTANGQDRGPHVELHAIECLDLRPQELLSSYNSSVLGGKTCAHMQ